MSAEEVERLITEGEVLEKEERYEEALAAFEHALSRIINVVPPSFTSGSFGRCASTKTGMW